MVSPGEIGSRFLCRKRSLQDNDIGGLTALTEESVVVGKIKLSADVRTNRIHVITRPVNIPFIRKLIARIRCQCGVRQTNNAAATLHFRRGRITSPGAGTNRTWRAGRPKRSAGRWTATARATATATAKE